MTDGIPKRRLGILAILFLAGCHSSSDGEPASLNDFGGSGVVLDTPLAGPFVLFQDDSTSRLPNRGGGVGVTQQNGVNNIYSIGAYVDPNDGNRTKLFVNDRGNHRVLIFNSVPRDATAQPDDSLRRGIQRQRTGVRVFQRHDVGR